MKEVLPVPARRRHSQIEIERIVSEYERGSCTQRELAERHGVCSGTIQNWLRRPRRGPDPDPSPWIEVVPNAPASTGSYRVELPNGLVVSLGSDWQAPRVRELIQTIARV